MLILLRKPYWIQISKRVCMVGGDSKSNMGRMRIQLPFTATVWGALNNSDRSCVDAPHLQWIVWSQNSISLAEDAKYNLPCQSLQVSALHEEHDNQLLRKGRDLPIHLPRVFPRQEILKGSKSASLVVYTDPATRAATCQLCPTHPKRKL